MQDEANEDHFRFNIELSYTIKEAKIPCLVTSKSAHWRAQCPFHTGQRLAGCPSQVEGVAMSNFGFSRS